MTQVSFAVVGVRNFAAEHIEKIQVIEAEGLGKLSAVVITDQERNHKEAADLKAQGITIYASYDELLQKGQGTIDVIALPTSIHSHFDLAKRAMEAGYNVLLEKPPVPTVQQMDSLMEIEQKTGQFCSIGFQMIHSRTLRRLKQMIVNGELGEIKELTCMGYWPRTRDYYARNPWAGEIMVDGQLVLDGPMHNALAHYLNNMIFLAGPTLDESAELSWVRAELYSSRPFITSDDTSCLEAETTKGSKIYFYVTHSSPENVDPVLEVVGTKGRAQWHFNEITHVQFNDGRELRFDNEGVNPWTEVMRVAAKLHRGEIAKPYSTLENSRSFVVAINGAYDSARSITPIPERYLEYRGEGDKQWTVVKDIMSIMDQARKNRELISDMIVPWGRATHKVSVENYKEFNPFAGPRRLEN